jgi:hypothetical protein
VEAAECALPTMAWVRCVAKAKLDVCWAINVSPGKLTYRNNLDAGVCKQQPSTSGPWVTLRRIETFLSPLDRTLQYTRAGAAKQTQQTKCHTKLLQSHSQLNEWVKGFGVKQAQSRVDRLIATALV